MSNSTHRMNNLTCDKCGEQFDAEPKQRKHGQDVVEVYFTCPHCQAHYTGTILDKAGRKMQRDVRKLQEQINQVRLFAPSGSEREDQLTYQLGQLGKKIAVKMEKLKKKYVKEAM